jgi:hypothetical protein
MKINISAQLEAARIFNTETQCIDSISVAGSTIGFVSFNKDNGNSATAFNADGRMSDVHCPGCAAKTLFAWQTGLDYESLDIVAEDVRVNPASLILSAILSSAVTKQ